MTRLSPALRQRIADQLGALKQVPWMEEEPFMKAREYLHLLATHPQPPAALRLPADLIRSAMRRGELAPGAAHSLREAARLVYAPSTVSPLRHACQIVLLELAIGLDDHPVGRFDLIASYCSLWRMPLARYSLRPPELPLSSADGRGMGREDAARRLAFQAHVSALCLLALKAHAGMAASKDWSAWDWMACLQGIRLGYGRLGKPLTGDGLTADELLRDYLEVGQVLWDWVAAKVCASGQTIENTSAAVWCEQAKSFLHLEISARSQATGGNRQDKATVANAVEGGVAADRAGLSMVVCRSPIVPSTDKQDRDEVERHLVLQEPLPVTPMPRPEELEASLARLIDEFPWVAEPLDVYVGQLIGMAKLGVQRLRPPPTLLVGPPGAGKSRLAMRLAEELGLLPLIVAAGGHGDSKVLAGTARGWGAARPNEVVSFMARLRCASLAVIVDELDKCGRTTMNDSGLQPYLLGLLEPQTAARHRDAFLLTECDLTGVVWLATANRLSTIADPLLSRFRVLLVESPRIEHFPAVARRVAAELARSWGVPLEALPGIEALCERSKKLASARQVRAATIAELSGWARDLVKH